MPTRSPQRSAFAARAYDEIFTSSAVGVAVWRDDGSIDHANQTLAELVGVAQADDLKGVFLSACFSEMYRSRISESLSRATRARSTSVVEAEVPSGGENRLLLVANIGAATRHGGISLCLDLGASLTALAVASPSDTTSAINRLNAALAHEINNPLAYAMGNLSFAIENLQTMVERNAEIAPIVLALRDALEGAERVRQTVRDLRLSARRSSLAVSSPAPDSASAIARPAGGAIGPLEPAEPGDTLGPGKSSGARLTSAARVSVSSQQTDVTATRRGRVLVVDDEPRIGSAIARILTPLHDVVAVYTARDAMIRLQTGESFDVILCDLMMPEMSGGDLYRAIASTLPELLGRVVFMTGGPFSGRGASVLESASNPRLEKPFLPEALRAMVQRVLGSNRPQAEGSDPGA